MRLQEKFFLGPHLWLLCCVFTCQSKRNKKHNMAEPALPSSLLGGKLVCFDHVFWAHHSGLACCSLCDKPSEYSDLSRQLRGLEERQERVMEMRKEQQCKFCWQTVAAAVLLAFEFDNVTVPLHSSVKKRPHFIFKSILSQQHHHKLYFFTLFVIKNTFN